MPRGEVSESQRPDRKHSLSVDEVREGMKRIRMEATDTQINVKQAKEIKDATDAYDRCNESIKAIGKFLDKNGQISHRKLNNYIQNKVKDTQAVLTHLEGDNRSTPFHEHILEQQGSMRPLDGSRDAENLFAQTKATFEKELEFWKKAQSLNENMLQASKMIENRKPYLQYMKPTHYEQAVDATKKALNAMGVEKYVVERVGREIKKVSGAIDAKIIEFQGSKEKLEKLTEMKQAVDTDFIAQKELDYSNLQEKQYMDKLQEYAYNTHNTEEKIDHAVDEANKQAEGEDKKKFVEALSKEIKPVLSEHAEELFEKNAPRYEANRFVCADKDIDTRKWGIAPLYFHPKDWRRDLALEESDAQYRDFSSNLPNSCSSVSLARIVSIYRPEVRASYESFQEKVQEIYNAHPRKLPGTGWSSQEEASYLNTLLDKKELLIATQDGKAVRFKVRQNYGYRQFKESMNVKDQHGQYIPVMVGIYAYSKETENFRGHVIVPRKQGDLYDKQGNHYIDFHVYDPDVFIKPANEYGLGHILEQTYMQQKYDGSEWSYKPGHRGYNEMVVPEPMPDSEK